MKLPISVIILTFNEELNIENCLKSVCDFAQEIFIVDSFSNDRTIEIARIYTDKIYQHAFETQAKQFNWALDNLPVKTDWIMRLDADERVTDELANELQIKLINFQKEITGLYVKRKVIFMGRFIRHGGYYPTWLLRIWRNGKGRSEDQILNEHIILSEGRASYLKNDIVDWNQKGLTFWIEKHNSFATRYAKELISFKQYSKNDGSMIDSSIFGSQEERKRWFKYNFYVHLPLFLRCFIYFFYRYFIRLGLLDGIEGLIFHVLQGFWYPFLADAKIYEIKSKATREENLLSK